MTKSVWCGLSGQLCCWFGETQTYNAFDLTDEIFENLNSISSIFLEPHNFLFLQTPWPLVLLQEAASLRFSVKNIAGRFFYQENVHPQNYWNGFGLIIVSSPPQIRGRGFLFLKFGQKGGSWKKKMLRNRGVSWKEGVLSYFFISFSLEKHVFIIRPVLVESSVTVQRTHL